MTVSAQPQRELPVPTVEESPAPAQQSGFTFFQAKPEQANSVVSPASPPSVQFQSQPAKLNPSPFNPQTTTTFQAVPAVRQEPRTPEIRQPPPPPTNTFQAQPVIRPEPRAQEIRQPPPPPTTTFQAQPARAVEITRPEQIPFQARPVSPLSLRPTQSASVGQANFFQGGQPLFSQPIEIPAEANGGASFSYEAIVG